MGLFGRESQAKTDLPVHTHRSPSLPTHAASSTTIAEGSRVSGDISGTSDVRIEGELDGSVSISGVVVVAESGKVRTSIRGARVTVSGKVDGDILGEQLIELETTAVVNGDLLAPKILIKEGATLQGRVEMASPPPANSSRGTKGGNKGKGKTGNQQGRNAPSEKPSTESGSNQPMDKQSQ